MSTNQLKRKLSIELSDKPIKRRKKNVSVSLIKDSVIAPDGRVFYPCQYCNKLFPIKKTRTDHIRDCPQKEYILTIGNGVPNQEMELEEEESERIEVEPEIPSFKMPIMKKKIKKSKLEVKNEENFDSIAKMLKNNHVTLIKTTVNNDVQQKIQCKSCEEMFDNEMELLKHSRLKHTYPKIYLPIEEIKQFYDIKDRTKCPICMKPLKSGYKKSNFIKHLLVHNDTMKYTCDICGKTFKRMDHMKDHSKRHIVEK